MSSSNSHDSAPNVSPQPEWLCGLRPASAAALKAEVFYQAGYEAAVNELRKSSNRQTRVLYATAASLLLAVASGTLCFQLGKLSGKQSGEQSGEQIASTEVVDRVQPREDHNIATRPPIAIIEASMENPAPLMSPIGPWLQTQVERLLPTGKRALILSRRGIELGKPSADWDSLVITQATNRLPQPQIQESKPATPLERQSLRTLRENQIRSLMGGAF